MTHTEIMVKLTVALFFGLFIGIDRQIKHKPLGLKTTMIICVASCLVTVVSIESFHRFATPVFRNMDPMRLTAQIVSGVGFLGAGVILRRSNDVISGLTSAALIWAASGLGIAVGVGLYVEATYAVLLFILAVNVIPPVVKKIGPQQLRQRDVAVKLVMEPNTKMTELLKTIEGKTRTLKKEKRQTIAVRNVKIKDVSGEAQHVNLLLSAPEDQYTTEIYYLFKKIEHVVSVEVEHL